MCVVYLYMRQARNNKVRKCFSTLCQPRLWQILNFNAYKIWVPYSAPNARIVLMLLKHQFEAALLCVYGRTHIYTYVCKSSGNEWREEKNLRFIFQCDITMLYDKKKLVPSFLFRNSSRSRMDREFVCMCAANVDLLAECKVEYVQ